MTRYAVNDIYPTIQGEGVQTGVPMVLLRLHGCDVGCPWCDTRETWAFNPDEAVETIEDALGANPKHTWQDAEAIAHYIHTRHRRVAWVLITGGEPARYTLHPLVEALHTKGYRCALETSGTESGHVDAGVDWICVSPKMHMPGGKRIRVEAVACADEIKMVIGREGDIQRLEGLLACCEVKDTTQICLQPVSQNPKATQLCIQTAQTRGWRLSLQMHKYIDQR